MSLSSISNPPYLKIRQVFPECSTEHTPVNKVCVPACACVSCRTFAPVWDVFKTSTEKLASCHLELVRKLQELIKDVQKYVDDQAKVHKKVWHGELHTTTH